MKRRIIFFWAQGESAAPDIVRRCWDAWGKYNADWAIEIHSSADAERRFSEIDLLYWPRTYQGIADIYRVLELRDNGGVYIDAATIPMRPLDDWLSDKIRSGFFAFHDPYRRRPVENWFIASEAGSPLISGWFNEIRDYWTIPRHPQNFQRELDRNFKGQVAYLYGQFLHRREDNAKKSKRVIEPKDSLWSVSEHGGGRRGVFPYFWPHYLFARMLERNSALRHSWSLVPKEPSYKQLMVRHWKRDYHQMTEDDLLSLIQGSYMQKLALNKAPSEKLLEYMFNYSEI